MDADGANFRLLPSMGNAYFPSWSPDDRRIAFEGGPGGFDVWIINADGTGLTNLTNAPSADLSPSWSP